MSASILVALLAVIGLTSGASVGVLNVCQQFNWPTGIYPHPSDCAKFIQCNSGITNEINCPNMTFFNPIKRVCDDIANVPLCQAANVDVSDVCNLYSWSNGIHYHPYDCSKYIECTFGRTDIMSCPPNLYFDPAVSTCDHASSNPYCTQYYTNAPVLSTPAGYPAGWANYCADFQLSTGIHVDPYSCLHFVECTFGRTTHMACPAGTAFNPSLLVCDDNANVNCGKVTVAPATAAPATAAPATAAPAATAAPTAVVSVNVTPSP